MANSRHITLHETDVFFALTGDVRYNSRALKQLRVLSAEGYRVVVLALADQAETYRLDDNITVHSLRRPTSSGPAFFYRWHRLATSFVAQYAAGVYHASDLYNLPAMRDAAAAHGAKLVYDARERYPYVASTAKRPWISWFWSLFEGSHIRKVDVVFTVSQSIASHISASYDIDLPEVLYNVPPLCAKVSSNHLREALQLGEHQTIILHQGKMQKDRGCLLLAHAMQYVTRAVLVFLGDGPLKDAVRAEVAALALEARVKFIDKVPPAQLHAYTSSADIGVTLLEDTCLNHRYALPNKLFEYLMAGLPVLASNLPEMSNVVQDFDVGRVVDPMRSEEIAAVLQEMIDQPELRTRWAANTSRVFETFSWEAASEVFRRSYKNLFVPVR